VKKLIRTPWVRSALSRLITFYLWFTVATMRWRFENRPAADAAVDAEDGLVACFWHSGIGLAVVCRRVLKSKPRRALVSRSRDGEFIAQAMTRLGLPTLRGSAGRQHAKLAKGGSPVFRHAVNFLKAGGVVAVTPDGPQGPAEVMAQGPVRMARAAGVGAMMVGLAARPTLRLKNWDGTRVPLPFSLGCVVFDGPLPAPDSAEDVQVEAARADWESRLKSVQARAEALVGGG